MVQLSDDCFAHNGALMTIVEALEQIETRLASVVGAENVPSGAAAGRVLAQDVVARMNLPPHANSAVDGYALALRICWTIVRLCCRSAGAWRRDIYSIGRSGAARQSASLLAR
jgi:hypothetical protein